MAIGILCHPCLGQYPSNGQEESQMRRILKASALLSTLLFTAAAVASQTATDASASAQGPQPSPDNAPPQVIYATNVTFPSTLTVQSDAKVVVNLNVAEDGTAQDVKIVDTDNPLLNGPVTEAVRKFRFRPAMLDDQPVAAPMSLTVEVQPVE
jgi:hypothetical protein